MEMGNLLYSAAVRAKSIDCVKLLVEQGANVDAQLYTGSTAIHQAAQEGLCEMVDYLLQHGARVSLREECDITPIFTAAHYGQIECLKLLLDSEQAIEEGMNCFLHSACMSLRYFTISE